MIQLYGYFVWKYTEWFSYMNTLCGNILNDSVIWLLCVEIYWMIQLYEYFVWRVNMTYTNHHSDTSVNLNIVLETETAWGLRVCVLKVNPTTHVIAFRILAIRRETNICIFIFVGHIIWIHTIKNTHSRINSNIKTESKSGSYTKSHEIAKHVLLALHWHCWGGSTACLWGFVFREGLRFNLMWRGSTLFTSIWSIQ